MSVDIRYVGPDSEGVILDEHDTRLVILPNEVVSVDDDIAERCLVQPRNWILARDADAALLQSTVPQAPVSGPSDPQNSPTPPDSDQEGLAPPADATQASSDGVTQ